jgi:hypothetical protein
MIAASLAQNETIAHILVITVSVRTLEHVKTLSATVKSSFDCVRHILALGFGELSKELRFILPRRTVHELKSCVNPHVLFCLDSAVLFCLRVIVLASTKNKLLYLPSLVCHLGIEACIFRLKNFIRILTVNCRAFLG